MVKMWVANTDLNWFDFLSNLENVDEVNFWQPSGNANFAAIQHGELFLFKLKSPRNVIGGFGVLSQASNLPLSLAWEAFGVKNGVRSLSEMRTRISKYRSDTTPLHDYGIGCRIVVQPVFFKEKDWIPQPESWANSIVVGKTYDTETVEGLRLWERLMAAAEATSAPEFKLGSGFSESAAPYEASALRYGEPSIIRPRLGQGAFRLAVTDAYGRQCAVSEGRVLPALDAAHIRAYGEGGRHEVSNGILLRKDIHSVFDAGYVTFDENLKLVVSDRVRTEFNNGNEYRRLQGSALRLPPLRQYQPNLDALSWHRENVFLG